MLVDRREMGEANPYAQFVTELRKLHLFAGEPSTRDLARRADRELKAKVSHQTVENALNGVRLPRWNIALILVKLLRGDERYFQQLWMAAKAHISGESTSYRNPMDDLSLDVEFNLPTSEVPARFEGPTESEPEPEPDSEPEPSGSSLTARASGALVRRTPWLSESAEADDPAVISLIRAALRDGVDVERLIIDIVAHDPRSAAPAVAAIAANALPKAAEIVGHLASQDLPGAVALLASLASTDPPNAAALLRQLLDERAIEPLPVAVVVVRLCRSGRSYRVLAKRVIVDLIGAGLTDQLASRVVEYLRSNRADVRAVAGAIEETLTDPESEKAGCQLLTWLIKADRALAAEAFLLTVMDFRQQRPRRGPKGRMLIGVVARRYPRICAALVLVWALREGLAALGEDDAAMLGELVLDLAEEDLALAADLAANMATNRRKTVMRLLAHTGQISPTGELLLEMASKDPKLPAGVLVEWISSTFPSVPVPPGLVVRSMANRDPATTVRILAAMAQSTDGTASAGKPFFVTGLDRRELFTMASHLRPHADTEEWQSIRPLLRLGRLQG